MERTSVESDPLGALLGGGDEDDSATLKKKQNQRKLEEANRWKGLSFEQESYLKKILIKHSIDKEMDTFSASPTLETVDSTVFLKYMYYTCILGFPLFRNTDKWKTSSTSTSTPPSSTPTTTPSATTPSPASTDAATPASPSLDDNNNAEVKISNDVKEDAAFLDSLACSDLKPQLDKLFLLYPKLRTLQKKALKGDIGRVGPLVDILDLVIHTALEDKTHVKVKVLMEEENSRKASDPPVSCSLSEKDSKEVKDVFDSMSVRRETLLLLQILLKEVGRQGSASPFYDTLLAAKTMDDLPILYRKLIGLVHVTPMIHFYFADPEKASMLKGIHNMIPKSTLKALFTIANPLRILANLLRIFLMRPLGKKNLLQRFLDVGTAISKTEEKLQVARNRINNKEVCDRIQNWVETNYKAAEHESEEEQKNPTAEYKTKIVNKILLADNNAAMQSLVQQLNKQQVAAIYDIVRLEMRKKEKIEYIEFFGSDQFIKPLEAVTATVTPPIIELTSKIDMPSLLTSYNKLMDGLLAVAESNVPEEEKAKRYHDELAKFENAMLPAIQQLVRADQQGHVLETLIVWTIQFFDYSGANTVVIDFKKLLDENLDDEDKFIIMAEVDAWIHYKRKDREYKDSFQKTPLQPPSQIHIPKLLCDPFLKVVRPYFEDKIKKSQ